MADTALSPVFIAPTGKIIVPLIGNPIGLWEGLRLALLRARPRVDDPRGAYPAITNADAAQVFDLWALAIGRDHVAKLDASGYRARWEAYAARIAPILAAADPAAPFADSRALWLDHSLDLARGLSVMYRGPSTAQQTLESIKHGAETIIAAGPAAMLGLGGQQLAAVGRLGSTAGAGVWNAVKVPLAIGAVVLGAVLIVPLVLPRRSGGG